MPGPELIMYRHCIEPWILNVSPYPTFDQFVDIIGITHGKVLYDDVLSLPQVFSLPGVCAQFSFKLQARWPTPVYAPQTCICNAQQAKQILVRSVTCDVSRASFEFPLPSTCVWRKLEFPCGSHLRVGNTVGQFAWAHLPKIKVRHRFSWIPLYRRCVRRFYRIYS